MNMVKVPMKVGGGFKQNASLKQGVQVSTAFTQRAETTTMHHHTHEKLGGDTCKPLYSQMLTKKEGRGRGHLPHKSKIWSSLYNCTTSQSEYTSSELSLAKTRMFNRGDLGSPHRPALA